ncbi:MAG: c-type cytochrome [Spirochaetota bacterium]
MKIIILIGSSIILIVLLLEAYHENLGMAWQAYQTVYRKEMSTEAQNKDEKSSTDRYEIKMRQVVLPEFNRVDRCISCHVGMEDPRMTEKTNPLKSHPGDILENHEVEKFGCTICHEGQGRGITTFQAHGQDRYWPYPLLDLSVKVAATSESKPKVSSTDLLQSSCYQCHNAPDLFRIADIGAETLASGIGVFVDNGCLSCHRVNGVGTNSGIELSGIGDKQLSEYDFSSFPEEEEKTIFNWHYQHLKNPRSVVPTSLMPYIDLSEKEIRSVVIYLLSLKKRGYSELSKFARKRLGGKEAFRAFCAGCHGRNGQGNVTIQFAKENTVEEELLEGKKDRVIATSLNNRNLLSSVSDQFLRQAIVNGRRGTRIMPASTFENTGIFPEEVDAVIKLIDEWRKEYNIAAPKNLDLDRTEIKGDSEKGKIVYHMKDSCSQCHGENGAGSEVAPQLNNQDFLQLASDSYIKSTILSDRMSVPSNLTDEQINNVIAYIRSWQK